MPLSDAIVVGQPKITGVFGTGLTCKFSQMSVARDIGTSGVVGSRDGKLKRGFYHSNVTEEGATWGSDSKFGPAQINQETAWYKDGKYRHPYDQSGLEITREGLKMVTRPIDQRSPREVNAARVKGFGLTAAGDLTAFKQDLQVPHAGEMLTTYGRFSCGFGEFEGRLRMPHGAIAHPTDINLRDTHFPAWWLLQDIPWFRNLFGNPFGGTTKRTAMPPKFNLGGTVTEIDIAEGFGYERDVVHQTLHSFREGNANIVSQPNEIRVPFDVWGDWFTAGVHITVQKIGFYINGIYTVVLATPPEIGLGMRVPIQSAGNVYAASGFTSAFQTHDGAPGSRRFVQFCMLLNVARAAKLTRNYAQLAANGGYFMPHMSSTGAMFVDYIHAKPLIVENPDDFGMTVRGKYIPTTSGGWDEYATAA